METTEKTLREQGIDAVRAYFKEDRYATLSGCEITDITEDTVTIELKIRPELLNANHVVMGGAIYTLADFAAAVASNIDGVGSVGVESSIRFYAASKGSKLIAVCETDRKGQRLGHYTVTVTDDLGKKIAGVTLVMFHT